MRFCLKQQARLQRLVAGLLLPELLHQYGNVPLRVAARLGLLLAVPVRPLPSSRAPTSRGIGASISRPLLGSGRPARRRPSGGGDRERPIQPPSDLTISECGRPATQSLGMLAHLLLVRAGVEATPSSSRGLPHPYSRPWRFAGPPRGVMSTKWTKWPEVTSVVHHKAHPRP